MAIEIPTLEEIREAVRQIVREELGRAGPDVLSTDQAAAYVERATGKRPTQKTIRNWIEAGLPATRRGRAFMIQRDELDRWLAGKSDPKKGDPVLLSLQRRTA